MAGDLDHRFPGEAAAAAKDRQQDVVKRPPLRIPDLGPGGAALRQMI
jgi:hypothetical protein